MASQCLPVYDCFQCLWALGLYHFLGPGYATLTLLIPSFLVSISLLREEVSTLFLHSHLGGRGPPHWLLLILFGPIPKIASFIPQAGLGGKKSESVSYSVMSNSLWPHRLLADFSVHGIIQARYRSGQPFPSLGHLPTQGQNLSLLHCEESLYHLSHQGNPKSTGVDSYSLLWGIFPTQGLNLGLPPSLQADSLPSEPPGKPRLNPGQSHPVPPFPNTSHSIFPAPDCCLGNASGQLLDVSLTSSMTSLQQNCPHSLPLPASLSSVITHQP